MLAPHFRSLRQTLPSRASALLLLTGLALHPLDAVAANHGEGVHEEASEGAVARAVKASLVQPPTAKAAAVKTAAAKTATTESGATSAGELRDAKVRGASSGDVPAIKPGAGAGEHAARSPAATRLRPAAAEQGSAEGSAPATSASAEPLDRVRERIARRLGAEVAIVESRNSVLRVASRPATAVATPRSSSPHAARPARHPAPAAQGSAAQWAYEGEAGPQTWGQLRPEFAQCAKGARQSPIDIRGGIGVQLEPIVFDYKAAPFSIVDNGHTVQVNVAAGSSIEVMGRRFELVQFHFHRPSEERVEGRQFDMVVHLVHKDLEGRLAVVAVLLERGSALQAVQTVWNNLPLEKGDEVAARGSLDAGELLPVDRGYYTYMGSLTTPPCSEGVLWMVMKRPMALSAEQLGIFSRLYPMNARPIQAASGRLIKQSN